MVGYVGLEGFLFDILIFLLEIVQEGKVDSILEEVVLVFIFDDFDVVWDLMVFGFFILIGGVDQSG